ncbi:hypothetical protein ANANG_G00245750 [Anguilla anguilla]|uniref:Transmembrane protein 82 n=1 Tax=Anguilla anguilla TaxID=7936 RepID=A0A9D3RM24_ANGAN|nr:hypothetical protein ANANG_G00245750 [Anguilla anguilla]
MLSFIRSWLPGIPGWLTFEANPLDSLLQGLVGACGVSVLCSLMRVHLFLKATSSDKEERCGKKPSGTKGGAVGSLGRTLQFWILTGLLGLIGPRVASLVVLEFCLRAGSAKITAGADVTSNYVQSHLVQCQFSLGCALSCSLQFLQEGALHRSLSLLTALLPSWLLASQSERLRRHATALYPLHSSQRYCGLCMTLLASGHALLPHLCRAVVVTFAVAAVAAISTVNHHFLSAADALRFWTPLTICYTMLVVYMQEDQHRRPGGEVLLHTAVVRLGALLGLMLMLGTWADVGHILLCFLGEMACLIPSQDLMDCVTEEESHEAVNKSPRRLSTDSSPVTPSELALPSSKEL